MENDLTADLVRRLSRFVALAPADRAELAGLVARAVFYDARRSVVAEGRRCDTLFLLVEGWTAEFRLLPDGGRQILKVQLPGDVISLDCLAYGVSLHGVQTLTPARLAAIPACDYPDLAADHPALERALFLMSLFERAVGDEWIVSLGRRPAWSRIAHLFMEIRERCAAAGPAATTIPFPLTQQDIADCTGLTIGYVNRVLGSMRAHGLVDLKPHELTIHDPDRLGRGAGFKPRYLHPAPPAAGTAAVPPLRPCRNPGPAPPDETT